MTLKRALIVILLLLVYGIFILIAYLWVYNPFEKLSATPTESPTSELKTNLQKWRAQNINHYRFTLEVSCMCVYPGPLIIEVKNSDVLSIIDNTGKAITINDDPTAGWSNIDFYAPFTTIDRMYAHAQDVLSQGGDFNGEYDSKLGFPTWMCFYNCGHLTPMEVDGYVVFRVSNFEKLP